MDTNESSWDRLKLPARVIIDRKRTSAAELAALGAAAYYPATADGLCDFEAGGQILARGRIVHRGGKAFFQVSETPQEERT